MSASSDSVAHKDAEMDEKRLAGYVGFSSITRQIEHKLLKRGFQFNVMVVVNQSINIGSTTECANAGSMWINRARRDWVNRH